MVQVALRSASAGRTRQLGAALGRRLQPGDFVGLVGDLGSGKTEFVRGVARGAGVAAAEVSSPTFAIFQRYQGRIPIYHADLYRVADEDELYATGFTELVGGEGAVLVEWIDRALTLAPADRLEIRFSPVRRSPGSRRIEITATGERSRALLALWRPRGSSSAKAAG